MPPTANVILTQIQNIAAQYYNQLAHGAVPAQALPQYAHGIRNLLLDNLNYYLRRQNDTLILLDLNNVQVNGQPIPYNLNKIFDEIQYNNINGPLNQVKARKQWAEQNGRLMQYRLALNYSIFRQLSVFDRFLKSIHPRLLVAWKLYNSIFIGIGLTILSALIIFAAFYYQRNYVVTILPWSKLKISEQEKIRKNCHVSTDLGDMSVLVNGFQDVVMDYCFFTDPWKEIKGHNKKFIEEFDKQICEPEQSVFSNDLNLPFYSVIDPPTLYPLWV